MGRTGITATQRQPARLSLPRPTGRYPVGTATRKTVASWRNFWNRTPGWRLDLTLRGASGENSYKDAEPLIGQFLRGQASPLLDAPSPRYPEIQFVR